MAKKTNQKDNEKNKRLKKNSIYLSVSILIFVLFSFVLFVNNLSDLLDKFGTPYNINLVAWLGIVFSLLWVTWLIINRVLMYRLKLI